MVIRFFLGACPHARYIAPPHIRYHLYKSGIVQGSVFEQILGRLNSKEVYTLISEYLVVAAESVPGLWRVLRAESGWDTYTNQAVAVCDGYLRHALPRAHPGPCALPPRTYPGPCVLPGPSLP